MDRILALREQGKSLREIAKELGVSHMTVARILRKSVTGSDVTPKTVTEGVAVTDRDVTEGDVTPVTEESVTPDVTFKLIAPVTKEAVTLNPTSKLEAVYKRTDPEVASYLHLFPEDVETFSFHME